MNLSPKATELLEKLQDKFDQDQQRIEDYLEGLLFNNYEPYWRYLAVDTLLSLQQPKTDIPDEMIFIGYHQITELYFKLIIHELEQMSTGALEENIWEDKLDRIVRYFKNLIDSFDIMIDGMQSEQFLKFRMSLLPASGFQSAQFRKIEMACTDLDQLVHSQDREKDLTSLDQKYAHIYWKSGSIEESSGKKTLTLRQFEEHYETEFLDWAKRWDSISQALRSEFRSAGLRVMNVFFGPTEEDEWYQQLPPPKVTSNALGRAVVDGLNRGLEDVWCGDIAKDFRDRFRRDPKVLEREMTMGEDGA